ncbi:MAG: family 10 glycosylhydrolase [Planctomycetes bacterium]|nr:family 10 glycosylhydrolase [Planctomycetota bacterium]
MMKRTCERGPGCFAVFAILGLWTLATLGGCQQPGKPLPRRADTIRAIWVTRWDYKTPGDIAAVMANCASAGFNTILFQVRGDGTAMYRSKLEPWSQELGGRDPGFDPLAVACREAHARGLALHAWVNVIPGWRGKKPPTNPKQLYHAHANWFWRDAAGRRQPLGWYNSLNPCYPEVRRYLVAVMREIVGGYPVDGLHMDYIRFPNEWNKSYASGARVPDYPRDARTLAMFRSATGSTPHGNPRAWNDWRTHQVTQLVRDIRSMVRRVKPRVKLSAAVGASPARAKRAHFQDTRRWIAEHLLDAVFPMNYDKNMAGFEKNLDQWARMPTRIPVVMGVMFDKRSPRSVIEQTRRTRRTGSHFAAFAYNSLFERRDARGKPRRDEQSASRASLRREVIPHLRRLAWGARRYAAR